MIIQRVNRSDAEKIKLSFHNVDADSVTTGMGVRWVGGAAGEIVSADGISGVKITADSQMPNFAGIAEQDIPTDGYGLLVAWGYVNSILLSAEANKTIGITGINTSFLKVGAMAGSFTSTLAPEALSTFASRYVQNFVTTNISGGLNYAKGFVRGM